MAIERKRTNIYIPVDLYDRLKNIADCYGNSVNGYLVWLIRQNVENYEQAAKKIEQAKQVEQTKQVEQIKSTVVKAASVKSTSVKVSDAQRRLQQRLNMRKGIS